ncbi:hypothetical protein FKM82_021434 [Ascaphus truei]
MICYCYIVWLYRPRLRPIHHTVHVYTSPNTPGLDYITYFVFIVIACLPKPCSQVLHHCLPEPAIFLLLYFVHYLLRHIGELVSV